MIKESPYLAWARSRQGIRYNLSRSGVRPCPLELLAPGPDEAKLADANRDGWPPLLERIARRYGVTPGQIVLTHGGSMANHLACATILERGDEVLVEHPVYEPLHLLPRYLGAEVKFFERRVENGFQLDVAVIQRQLSPRTRLVLLSNLHNPSGALVPEAALRELGRLAEQRGFLVLIDEVYLEFFHAAGRASAVHLSPQFVVTRSLTKAYGLDGLRAGWILAAPALAERMRRLNDLFSITTAHPTERLAARALDRAAEIAAPVMALLALNRALLDDFVAAQPRLSWTPPAGASIGFIRVNDGRADELIERLERQYDVTLAPGRFFGRPDHFRIGFGGETEALGEALARLGAALRG